LSLKCGGNEGELCFRRVFNIYPSPLLLCAHDLGAAPTMRLWYSTSLEKTCLRNEMSKGK